jgi:UDP-sulfoquinovose synthase
MGIEEKRKKTVLILGIDGYIGWSLAQHLRRKGYEIEGIDNYSRRFLAESLIPISDEFEREQIFHIYDNDIKYLQGLSKVDAIIHLAEQPSASWSMKSCNNAYVTQEENVLGTLNLLWLMKEQCPDAHLIKLGSMGECGTPDCDIPEGFIEDGPMKGLMFPRTPNSFYHLSKVFDSMNIEFACRTWGLRSTDIMQGIVFGHQDGTRFDYDEHFGTVINRFCTQAVAGIPLTVYGSGGQTRSFLPLKDSIECLTRVLENPPKKGEYRVFNQFAQKHNIASLAQFVKMVGNSMGLNVGIKGISNPRKEEEFHHFNPKNDKLKELGYNPKWKMEDEIRDLIEKILPYKDRINKDVIMPKTQW